MNNKQNILQYELYHVGNNLEDCLERIYDGIEMALVGDESRRGIKTVIRIYDTDNKVTNLISRIENLESKKNLVQEKSKKRFIQSWLARHQLKSLSENIETLSFDVSSYSVEYLKRSLRYKNSPVGIEKFDFSFRFAQRNEVLELIESVQKAKKTILYIFESNELLSDKNKRIVTV